VPPVQLQVPSIEFLLPRCPASDVQPVAGALQVEWNNPEDPTKGFKYIYLAEDDYKLITMRAPTALSAAAITENGESLMLTGNTPGVVPCMALTAKCYPAASSLQPVAHQQCKLSKLLKLNHS
jgi:hypothetical protein